MIFRQVNKVDLMRPKTQKTLTYNKQQSCFTPNNLRKMLGINNRHYFDLSWFWCIFGILVLFSARGKKRTKLKRQLQIPDRFLLGDDAIGAWRHCLRAIGQGRIIRPQLPLLHFYWIQTQLTLALWAAFVQFAFFTLPNDAQTEILKANVNL